ncbi:hypothetical protein FKW77_006060 [Venturia effusa]|uniref:Uncharacterized protein n=1 Tax=Venturia effusa TaxID=50376 RepID=A0A517L9F0_9PEZI|nr:hypothetical protein FKW77_006060 [Venturia effusa]
MKVFEIDDETGEQVEIDENGIPIPRTSPTAESPKAKQDDSEGHSESSPPPMPAFSFYANTPISEDHGNTPGQTPCSGNPGQQQQFVSQGAQQHDYYQRLRNDRRRREEDLEEMLAQKRARLHEQRHARQQQAQATQQVNSFRTGIQSANDSFLSGSRPSVKASNGFSRMAEPRSIPNPFGGSLCSPFENAMEASFPPPLPFSSNAGTGNASNHHNAYGASSRYHSPDSGDGSRVYEFRRPSTLFEKQFGSPYDGENQNGRAEQDPVISPESGGGFRNAPYHVYPAKHKAPCKPEFFNESFLDPRSRGRGQEQPDDEDKQLPAYRRHHDSSFGESQQ